MASSLPPEIWFAIIDYLPGNDQLRVARVSPQLCSVARKIVYRYVELRSNHVAVAATLTLLTRDYSVARNVRRLHIYTNAEATTQEPTWFDSDVLAGMTNLCWLDLTGMPFHTEEDQVKFNNIVSESLLTLRKLKYVFPYPIKVPSPEAHVPVLQIGGLQEITWIVPDTFKHTWHIINPLNTSRETLTHIRIPMPTTHAASYEPLTRFFSLCFPRLSTLHLGGWSTVTPVATALTKFLVAHPLIEDLHLGFSHPFAAGFHCHISPDVTLGPGTLPNLRRLTVDSFNFGIFIRSGVSSLQTLETLHIDVGYFEAVEREVGFAETYSALEACGGLPGLKTLELELYGLRDGPRTARWITGFGKLCPKVERFWGDYKVGRIAVSNQDIFASYCNLKSQVIPGTGLDDLSEQDRMNYVKDFAARNSSVIDLRFYAPEDVDDLKFHYRMGRDTEGRITAMVEVLENEMEIKWI